MNLTKFITNYRNKIIYDINITALINKKIPPVSIEIPVMKFANKDCLCELGGFNPKTNKGVSMVVLDENLDITNGIKFFKGNRKNNGKQALVPIMNGYHVIIGNLYQSQNKFNFKCKVFVYVISGFENRTEIVDGETINFKICRCNLLHYHSSQLFNDVESEYNDEITMALEKAMIKKCNKSVYTNAWFEGNFENNEISLFEGIEDLIRTKPKKEIQIANARNYCENLFIEEDRNNVRVGVFVFDISQKSEIIIYVHLLDKCDIRTIKQDKKASSITVKDSIKIRIPTNHKFEFKDTKFFMVSKDTNSGETIKNMVSDIEKNNLNFIDGIPFMIRLFKG